MDSVLPLNKNINFDPYKEQVEKLKNLPEEKVNNLSPAQKAEFEKAARGFESIFIHMMMKEMKSAMLDEEDEEKESFGADTLMGYTDMMFADNISKNAKGIGIAEKIYSILTNGEKLPETQIDRMSESKVHELPKRPEHIPMKINPPQVQQFAPVSTDFLGRVMKRLDDYEQIITEAANKFNVPDSLIKSVIAAESAGKNDAKSPVGAKGLMQLMDGTAKNLDVTNSYDPYQNIMGGTRYLRQMLDKFDGNIALALAAYNAGPMNVIRHDGIPPFKETQNYVNKVLKYRNLIAGKSSEL